jgi:hypothetical protein
MIKLTDMVPKRKKIPKKPFCRVFPTVKERPKPSFLLTTLLEKVITPPKPVKTEDSGQEGKAPFLIFRDTENVNAFSFPTKEVCLRIRLL